MLKTPVWQYGNSRWQTTHWVTFEPCTSTDATWQINNYTCCRKRNSLMFCSKLQWHASKVSEIIRTKRSLLYVYLTQRREWERGRRGDGEREKWKEKRESEKEGNYFQLDVMGEKKKENERSVIILCVSAHRRIGKVRIRNVFPKLKKTSNRLSPKLVQSG